MVALREVRGRSPSQEGCARLEAEPSWMGTGSGGDWGEEAMSEAAGRACVGL